jgi:LytS/YehU family sensor histidine kinase
VRLREELDFVRIYLVIEQKRFGKRLQTRIEADETLMDAAVAPMLIQPLVENAVNHGIAPKADGGTVTVRVRAIDIIWIEAAEDYALLHTTQGTFTASTGIGELEKRLDNHVFMRVHRSAIINTGCIKHVESDAYGNLTVHLSNNAKVKVSRSYTAQIRGLIV